MTARESMLQKLQASQGAAEFAAALSPTERDALTENDIQPSPWRPHDPMYVGRNNCGHLAKTALSVRAMPAHGLVPVSPLEALDFLAAEDVEHLRSRGLL